MLTTTHLKTTAEPSVETSYIKYTSRDGQRATQCSGM
jgi:hypothetical protein